MYGVTYELGLDFCQFFCLLSKNKYGKRTCMIGLGPNKPQNPNNKYKKTSARSKME